MLNTKVFTVIISVILFWTTTDVVQGRYVYQPQINRWIQQDKVVATWEQAKQHCETQGAILASPITEALLEYMTSIIDVNESSYFIGMRTVHNTEDFASIEGILLDNLPETVINMIDKLDPKDGDCLAMTRNSIRAVPCWSRMPYICYLNTTTSNDMYLTSTTRTTTEESASEIDVDRWSTYTDRYVIEETGPTTEWPGQPTDCGSGDLRSQIFNDWSSTYSDLPCATLRMDGVLDDRRCDFNYPFICEKSKEEATTPTAPHVTTPTPTYVTSEEIIHCGSGYKHHSTGRCYKAHNEFESWDDAQSICSKEGGYLTVVNDEHEARVLNFISYLNFDSDRMWVGLQKVDGIWRSVQGDLRDQIFDKWSSIDSDLPCGTLKTDGLLDDWGCDLGYPFVCEKSKPETTTTTAPHVTTPTAQRNETTSPTPGPTDAMPETPADCGSGYQRYSTGSCYKVHEKYKSWDFAQLTCYIEGGYLAVINDEHEARVLKSITSRPDDHYTHKWIGLRQMAGVGDWRSVLGDRFDQIYNVWSDSASGLLCGSFKTDGLLDDQDCEFYYRFICEKNGNNLFKS